MVYSININGGNYPKVAKETTMEFLDFLEDEFGKGNFYVYDENNYVYTVITKEVAKSYLMDEENEYTLCYGILSDDNSTLIHGSYL